jgi:putative transcriptional regulator
MVFDPSLGNMNDLLTLDAMKQINRIKEILKTQGRSQVWLAEQLDRNAITVNAYCNNRKQPSLFELDKIAGILDVDIRELLVSTK